MFVWLKLLDVFVLYNIGVVFGGVIFLYKNMLEYCKFIGVYNFMKYFFVGVLVFCLWVVGGMY